MIILIAYDIADNNVRLKLANYLQSKGLARIQKSVFTGTILPTTLKDLDRTLPGFVKNSDDVIHLIPLLEYSLKNMKHYGNPLNQIKVERETLRVV
ncbi:CRISPR-associated endonuclease Cas2 [Thermosphaera sp.]